MHLTDEIVQSFRWAWRSRSIEVVYEVLGSGAPVLVLPPFSTVSSREEMRPLASRLALSGFACTLVDWPGFGSSTRGRLDYGPDCYLHFLGDFAAATIPIGAAVIAAGHASGYALRLGHERPGVWRRIALLAPTWRGPLPTAMGPHPKIYAAVRTLVGAPIIGEALYRVNIHSRVIAMMYRRHVYAEGSRITPGFVANKRGHARRPGARFASAAFVTGALDPFFDRLSFQAFLASPPAPTLILCGESTPPKSKAEMAAIPSSREVLVQWVAGSLGLYEEEAESIVGMIAAFLTESE
jgi:pimeloyl-ACP methyl ester carboxylesterase